MKKKKKTSVLLCYTLNEAKYKNKKNKTSVLQHDTWCDTCLYV